MVKDGEIKKTKSQIQTEKIMSLLDQADAEQIAQEEVTQKTDSSPLGNGADEESFQKLYENSLKTADFKEGDVVKGRIASVESDYVLVDIKYKSEGLIPKSEFCLIPGEEKDLQVGQEIEVYIDRIENDEGMMVLSKDRADIIRIWKDISKVVDNEEVIEGTVIAKVKGGLSVDIGVKAFLPGSQIELRPVRNLNSYIGKKYQFKVIKFNQKRGNIVLSRRALLSQERKNLRTRTLSEIKEGALVKGVVKNITDYGAFLDLGGLDGLLHITDMSWSRIKHPSEVISLGAEVEVKILKFDQEKNRVSLGLKQLQDDPWSNVSKEFKIDDVVKAQVVNLADYGAFLKLRDGVEGLVHVSEMSWGKKIQRPSEMLEVGQEVDVKILGIDQENHRISLGIRQLTDNPWIRLKEEYPVGTELEGEVKSVTDFGMFIKVKGEEEVDGFIHASDLSWTKHIDPKTKYKVGDVLKSVFSKGVSVEDEHFNLTLKKLEGDPWLHVESKYPPGSRHEVRVVKLMDFGVFVELEPGVEGLIHVSELSTTRVEDTKSFVKLDENLTAEVLSIDLEARKIGLSVKQVELRKEGKSELEISAASAPRKKKTESFFGKALKASLGIDLSGKNKTEKQSAKTKETKTLLSPDTRIDDESDSN